MSSSSRYYSDIKIAGDVVYLLGDIHAKVDWASKLDELTPGPIIILGDVGFGFSTEADERLQDTFVKLQEKGWSVYLIRGNHDNPEYWHNIQRGCTMLPENRVITINDKPFFISGGGTSVDRWQRLIGKSYWPSEYIYVPPYVLQEVDYVYGILSHVGPTPPKVAGNPIFLEYCKLHDSALEADLEMENIQLKRLVCLKPKVWYYGHFHVNETFEHEGIRCQAINIATLTSINFDL